MGNRHSTFLLAAVTTGLLEVYQNLFEQALRPPIVDSLFLVIHLHGNFSAACKLIMGYYKKRPCGLWLYGLVALDLGEDKNVME